MSTPNKMPDELWTDKLEHFCPECGCPYTYYEKQHYTNIKWVRADNHLEKGGDE